MADSPKPKKYILDNLENQTIEGTIKTNSTGKYRALLTQTDPVVGNNISDFNYGLIIGETYTITDYIGGDDFSNIAEVISATTSISFYNISNIEVNNMEELITTLNYDDGTNFLGVYSIDPNVENGIILTIPSNLMNQLSPDAELTFEVFND